MQKRKSKLRADIIVMFFVMLFNIAAMPPAAHAQGTEKKVVRVGWHETPYFIEDQYGRWSGYSYDYQCKVAAYTGWTYAYVKGTWSELLRMLMNGEIDMLSDVSYLNERAEKMLYSSIPMGTEVYYVFTAPGNTEISAEDYTTLNGKRVGVAQNTFQKSEFIKWAGAHGVSVELVETTGPEEESLKMLGNGLDAYVTMDVYSDPKIAVPVCKVGSSDFYFAVSKSRPDLLKELDAAMNQIQDEDMTYSLRLHDQYLKNPNESRYLGNQEKEWLSSHEVIRVGYQDNYLAFCARDPETGELTGALKDYLELASKSMENAQLRFEATAYPTAVEAMKALENGEVDCVFPANLSNYDSERIGIVMTPPLIRAEMDAVVRATEQKEFLVKDNVTVAVNQGNTNYDMFLADHYPGWQREYFKDTPTGLEAVAAGRADCVIISNYRFGNISKQCKRLNLTTVYTGKDMDYCFAVKKGNVELYSILARVTGAVLEAPVHTALTYYSTEDAKVTFPELIKDNLLIVMTVTILVLIVFLILLYRGIRAERKARKEEHMVNALNKRVFVDALTSVRNKGAFYDYIQDMQNKLDAGERLTFAIGVFDCDDLKSINDRFGHDKGDLYLKTASRLICEIFDHSPVFRIGGDEFAIVLQNNDFTDRDALVTSFDERQKEITASAGCEWDEIHVSLGIAVYDPSLDVSVSDTARRADKIMYENKQRGKRERQSRGRGTEQTAE